MEARTLCTAPIQDSSTSSIATSTGVCHKAPDSSGEPYTHESTHRSMVTDVTERTGTSQQSEHMHSNTSNRTSSGRTSPPLSAGAPVHLTTSEPDQSKLLQHHRSTRRDRADSSLFSTSLSKSTSCVPPSATNQSFGCSRSYCEQLRERLEQNRRQFNPHLLEGESIHDRIDAALNPDWHMRIKRCSTPKGRLQYDCDHLRIVSELDMISAEHCYLTDKGVALADIQSMARRMEYGSIDPVSCITGLPCSPALSGYRTFQQLTTPQVRKARTNFRV